MLDFILNTAYIGIGAVIVTLIAVLILTRKKDDNTKNLT